MTRPKDSDRKDIKALVLKNSKQLFLKYGYANVTMRRIAEAIGFSPAAIYLYFQTKDEIFYMLRSEGMHIMHIAMQKAVSAAGPAPFDRLKAIGRAYVHFAMANKEYYDLMFMMQDPSTLLDGCDYDAYKDEDTYNLLKSIVQDCINDGHFKGSDVETGAFTCWSMVHGMSSLIIRNIMPIPKEHIEPFLDQSLDCFMNLSSKTNH